MLHRSPPIAALLLAALLLATCTRVVSGVGFTISEGELLAISDTSAGQVLSVDSATGAKTLLFTFDEVGSANRVALQRDYVGVTPGGNLLLQGRSFDLVVGATEFYELDPATMALAQISDFQAGFNDPSTPVVLRDPLGSPNDADGVFIEPDGRVLIMRDPGDVLFRFNPATAEASIFRGALGTLLPTHFQSMAVLPSGAIVGSGGPDTWLVGDSPAEDQIIGSFLDDFAVVASDNEVASYDPNGHTFEALNTTTGATRSLDRLAEFLPVEDPPITVDNFIADDFVVRGDDLYVAGLGAVWEKPAGSIVATRLDGPFLGGPLGDPDPVIRRLLIVPALAPGLPGDFNGDGQVDTADYTVWRDNLGTGFDLAGNGDEADGSAGVVDIADYELWRDALDGQGSNATASPEPTALYLALSATPLLLLNRRNKK